MFSSELRSIIATLSRTTRIIWIALMASIALYVVVAFVVVKEPRASDSGSLGMPLAAIAMATAGASLALRHGSLSDAALVRALAKPLPEGQVYAVKARGLPAAERRLLAAAVHMQTALIPCLALNEAIAIFGLVLAFQSGRPEMSLPFAAAALALDVLLAPDIEKKAEALWVHAQCEPGA